MVRCDSNRQDQCPLTLVKGWLSSICYCEHALGESNKKIYKGDIEHKVSENTDSQYDPKFSCSFNIHKSGNDDKQNAYEYIQVEGELDIDYDLTFGGYPSDIPEKNWKISDASPTYLRDNMKGALSVHANGNLPF